MDMEKVAEICGIHAGDGWLSSRDNEVGYATSIHEEQYFDYVYSLYSEVLGMEGSRVTKEPNVKKLRLNSKRVANIFMSFGFPKGPKTYTVSTPDFVLSNKKYMERFLRGIVDTDGSVHWRRSGNTHYLTIAWNTSSEVFASQIRDMLKNLGFKPTFYQFVNTKANNMAWHIMLQNMSDTSRFIKEIGFRNNKKWNSFFSNPKHLQYMSRAGIEPAIFPVPRWTTSVVVL